jgi:hypothetical protein
MKYLALILLLSGCVDKTKYGMCVGITEEKNPTLNYKVSEDNLFWALLGFETVIVPAIVLANEFSCPISAKTSEQPLPPGALVVDPGK